MGVATIQSALSGSLSERLETTVQWTRVMLQGSRELVTVSRELCQRSRELMGKNADLQEFLRDNVVNAWSRHEHRQDHVSRVG